MKTDAAEQKKKVSLWPIRSGRSPLRVGDDYIDDEGPQHPYKTRLDNVNFKVTGLTNQTGKKANVELAFESDSKRKTHSQRHLANHAAAGRGKTRRRRS